MSLRHLLHLPARLLRAVGDRRLLAGPALVLILGASGFAVMAATGPTAQGAPANGVSTSPSDIAAGQSLYIVHCESCHGVNGVGGSNGSPELIDAGAAAADFYLTTGRMPLNNPADEAIRHHPYFDDQQIRQLDAYVNALPAINHRNVSGPSIPTVAPLCAAGESLGDCVTLSEGQQEFSLNCAQCHQAAGSGGMLSRGNVVPSLHASTATQAVEAMLVGPKPMPVFGTTLSSNQKAAIAHYVEYLRKPADSGGLGISGFGPVAEGFVGIILGLGVLLVASRLIGNRG